MKKIIAILLCAAMVLAFAGCAAKEVKQPDNTGAKTEEPTGSKPEEPTSGKKAIIELDLPEMKVKEGTLTDQGATFIITNNTDQEFSYGVAYEIARFTGDGWGELVPKEIPSWIAIAYMLEKDQSQEFDINFNFMYGGLEPGYYRLQKNIVSEESNGYTICANFEIK